MVSFTYPSEGVVEAPPDLTITAQFSSGLDPTTVDTDTFRVTADGVPVTGAVSYEYLARRASFLPNNVLPRTAQIQVTLTTGIRTDQGGSLDENYMWSFTTFDHGWWTPRSIDATSEDSLPNSSGAKDLATRNGVAFAVWRQLGPGGHGWGLWASRYTIASGWEAASLVEADPPVDSSGVPDFQPRVAVDLAGNAFVVWQQWNGNSNDIRSSRFGSSGWSTSELLELDPGDATLPVIAVDSTGNAVAAWTQSNGTAIGVRVNRFRPGSGWGAAQWIDTDATDASEVDLGLDGSANGLVVWEEHVGASSEIRYARYQAATGWSSPGLVVAGARTPRVSVAAGGDAFVVFNAASIGATRSSGGATWEPPVYFGSGATAVPRIAIDGAGNAVAIWAEVAAPYELVTTANRYVSGAGWEAPMALGIGWVAPELAMNAAGSAVVVQPWLSPGGDGLPGDAGIGSARFDVGAGWTPTDSISGPTHGAVGSSECRVAIDDDGHTIAVWTQGSRAIANVYH